MFLTHLYQSVINKIAELFLEKIFHSNFASIINVISCNDKLCPLIKTYTGYGYIYIKTISSFKFFPRKSKRNNKYGDSYDDFTKGYWNKWEQEFSLQMKSLMQNFGK